MINEAFRDELKKVVCRESFRHFISYVQPSYIFNWHHLALIDALQLLADRKIKRLIVMMPPRHGKSELVSRLFPAWILGRNPDEQVITSSYSATLASAMNRDCQRIISSTEYGKIFPESKLADGKTVGVVRTNDRFDIVGSKGYLISAGVGGGITGAGATVGIIDDPVKNSEEADSQTYRSKAWEWYTTTFKTRFEPGCVEVICQTRWHEDDLTGRILARLEGEEGTEIISFPAICEAPEQHREIGQPLWESKYNRAALLDIQKQVGTRSWYALYQQRPSPGDGGVVKKAWFSWYDPLQYSSKNKRVNFFFDTAYTEQENNDPCAGIAYVKEGADFYVLDYEAKYLDFPAQVEFVKDFAVRNGYTSASIVRVEPKATGKSLVQVMKKNTKLNIRDAVAPKESKIARINAVSPTVEAGRVHLPLKFAWTEKFLDELAAFPNAAHDESADCLSGMILNELGRIGVSFA